MSKKKLFIVTTVPMSLIFFKGQLSLLREEFDVTLISSPERELYETADFYKIGGLGIRMKREISLLHDFLSLSKLIFCFYRRRPDIVHANTPKGSFLSLAASWFCRVPKRIYYVHGLRYQGLLGFQRKLLILMEKLSCFFATDIIAVSNGVKDVLLNDGIARKNVEIIWNGSANGIDSDFFNSDQPEIRNIRLDYNIGENDFIFGFVGRLTGDKGINELVSVFTEIAKDNENVKLLLVGGFENDIDSLMEVTMNDIHSNSNIIHVGIQKDVRSFLAAMDVFVFPSYREGFGIALMEAAAMNVPAISSNIIGCNEIIEENVTGFLIPPRNEEALFERMKHCIQNQSEIKQMSLITRQAVISKYEQKKLWSATMLFYRKLQNV